MLKFLKNLFKKEEVVKQEEEIEITVVKPKAVDLYKTTKHSRKSLVSCRKAVDTKVEELIKAGISQENLKVKDYFDRKDNDRLNGYRLFNSSDYSSIVYFVPKKEVK